MRSRPPTGHEPPLLNTLPELSLQAHPCLICDPYIQLHVPHSINLSVSIKSSELSDRLDMTAAAQLDTAPVRLRTKLGFWLLIGMMSTAMAEVLSGSFIYPFAAPAGWLIVVPVYLLHAVVGLWIVHRFAKPVFATLFLVGMLFGFYEFYLTKVLWEPPWGTSLSLGGIDVFSFIILALWWHPILAFIGPLAITETVATSTRSIAANLPFNLGQTSRRTAAALLFTVAAVQGFVALAFVPAVVSLATTGGALGLAIWMWRRSENRRSLPLASLVPSDRQAIGLITAMAGMYVGYWFLFNPDAMPPLASHLTTWILCGAVILLLIAALKTSAHAEPKGWSGPRSWWPPRWRRVAAIYVPVVLTTAATGLVGLGFIVIWGAGIVLGPVFVYMAIRYVVDRQDPKAMRDSTADAERAPSAT